MAGERKGKTYEAITHVALERLKIKGKFKGKIFWNKTPKGMTIEPDLLVGNDVDHPSIVFLVTHSGSAGDSHKKFWRNLGELAEAKVFLSSVPRVYNVAFDSVIKENLKKIQAVSFDGQLIVGDLSYGKSLQTWVDKHQKDLPKLASEKAEGIMSRLSKDSNLKALVGQLESDIEKLIKQSNPKLDELWKVERKRQSGRAPDQKDYFFRRAIIKALLVNHLPDKTLIVPESKKDLTRALGLSTGTIAGEKYCDRDLIWLTSYDHSRHRASKTRL